MYIHYTGIVHHMMCCVGWTPDFTSYSNAKKQLYHGSHRHINLSVGQLVFGAWKGQVHLVGFSDAQIFGDPNPLLYEWYWMILDGVSKLTQSWSWNWLWGKLVTQLWAMAMWSLVVHLGKHDIFDGWAKLPLFHPLWKVLIYGVAIDLNSQVSPHKWW